MYSCKQPLSLCKKKNRRNEEFWMNDVRELYKGGNYLRFFPKYEMTRVEQLNSITRLCIYFIFLVIMFDRNEEWLYLPITMIVLIVVLYNVNKYDEKGKNKELEKILRIRKDKRDKELEEDKIENMHDGDVNYKTDIDPEEEYLNKNLQAGYYDSDGVLRIGNKLGVGKYHKEKEPSLYTVDELLEYEKNTCRRPTNDNPLMNPSILDYNNGDPPAACNADDDDIKNSITVQFNHNLFRDVDELWERENSQRQFYTIPNTAIPNNQVEFAKWLYKVPETCKEDQENCLRYESLRYKRDPNTL